MRSIPLIVMVLLFGQANAQTKNTFQAFPDDSARLYQFNLSKNFFSSDQAEFEERRQLLSAADKIDRDFGLSKLNQAKIYTLISQYDSLSKKIGKHSAYLVLSNTINLSEAGYSLKLDSFTTSVSPILSSINDKISKLPPELFGKGELGKYEYFFRQLKDDPSNKLPSGTRNIIGDITPNLIGWQSRLFQTVFRTTDFKEVETPNGKLSLRKNSNEIYNNSDRNIRRAGYLNNLEGNRSNREVYAFALIETVKNRNKLAGLSGFKDFPTQNYSDQFLTVDEVKHLLNVLKDSAFINKQYETLVFENIKKIGNIDTVFGWDRLTPDPRAPTPRFTITEASNTILEATRALGIDYYSEMSKLLNPQNGRLDMVSRPNRVIRPGFSTGSVGYNSVFFQGNYEGFISDLIIFGHEAGHAVQNMLMDKNRVSYFYAYGPSFFTESFAGFNELLITDYLYQKAQTKEYKKYYLGRFLDQATELFINALDAYYEQSLYDSIPNGKINSADQLELQMQKVGSAFSLWYQPYLKNEMQWVNKLQFITNPLYRKNYVYSKLLALYYFDRFKTDAQHFIPAYNLLLRNGYDAEPRILLKKFLDIELNGPPLIHSAMELIKSKITEYRNLVHDE